MAADYQPADGVTGDSKCSSHHHQPRSSSLHPLTSAHAESASTLLCASEGIAFAIHLAAHLKVVVPQAPAAVSALQAALVELASVLCLQVLALDATIASLANGAIDLVVVTFAVRPVGVHIEGGRGEGLGTCRAHKAWLVVTTRQTTIGRRYRFAFDGERAGFAVAFRRRWTALGGARVRLRAGKGWWRWRTRHGWW
jgi:hypothetical protein